MIKDEKGIAVVGSALILGILAVMVLVVLFVFLRELIISTFFILLGIALVSFAVLGFFRSKNSPGVLGFTMKLPGDIAAVMVVFGLVLILFSAPIAQGLSLVSGTMIGVGMDWSITSSGGGNMSQFNYRENIYSGSQSTAMVGFKAIGGGIPYNGSTEAVSELLSSESNISFTVKTNSILNPCYNYPDSYRGCKNPVADILNSTGTVFLQGSEQNVTIYSNHFKNSGLTELRNSDSANIKIRFVNNFAEYSINNSEWVKTSISSNNTRLGFSASAYSNINKDCFLETRTLITDWVKTSAVTPIPGQPTPVPQPPKPDTNFLLIGIGGVIALFLALLFVPKKWIGGRRK